MSKEEPPQWIWDGSGYSAPHADHWQGDTWVFIADRERHGIALEPEEMTAMCKAWLSWLPDEEAVDVLNDMLERFQLEK